VSIAAGDELEEMICAEMLEALELSRCLFLMKYEHKVSSNALIKIVHD